MRRQTPAWCLCAIALAAISCGDHEINQNRSVRNHRGEPTGDQSLSDWGFGGSTPTAATKPRRMDPVLRKIDSRVKRVRFSRLGYSYRRPRRPPPSTKDTSLAPYFHIPGQKPSAPGRHEQLPLKSTTAEVTIAGVIAHVRVQQVYHNRGKQPIEAIYTFPGSTRAAVHAMRMKIGKRLITARIDKRARARAAYEAARRAGRRASLLEQQRANVFTMNVANIMPGDRIEVQLDYSELIEPEDGIYSFVYPGVVGPRNPMGAARSDTWIANPYLEAGTPEPYRWSVTTRIHSPIGIQSIASPSHPVRVAYQTRKKATIELSKPGGGNRDYVLRYRLAGDRIETGTMLYDHGGEKFFLVMMEPPRRIKRQQIPPREYIFVIDVSGSMYGFPLQTAKALIRKLFAGLTARDRFNVVVFAGRAGTMHPTSIPATPANLQSTLESINRIRGGGGTNLMDALRTSFAIPRPAAGYSRSLAIITDGYVAVEAQAFRYIRKHLGQGNVFGFGIGSSVNRALIEGIARAGMGRPFVVLNQDRAPAVAEKFRQYIQHPVLTDIDVRFEGLKVYDVVPKRLPDLMAQRPLIMFGKYRGASRGRVIVKGTTGAGAFKKTMILDPQLAHEHNRPLRVLWARKWAQLLMDQHAILGGDGEIEAAVQNLGLTYNLLTRFTSFVAVDREVVRRGGKLVSVKQPLPLPAGVSNQALPSAPQARPRYRPHTRSRRRYPRVGRILADPLAGGSVSPSTRPAESGSSDRPTRVSPSKTAYSRPRVRVRVTGAGSDQVALRRVVYAAARRCRASLGRAHLVFGPRGTIRTIGSSPLARCLAQALRHHLRRRRRRFTSGRTITIRVTIR